MFYNFWGARHGKKDSTQCIIKPRILNVHSMYTILNMKYLLYIKRTNLYQDPNKSNKFHVFNVLTIELINLLPQGTAHTLISSSANQMPNPTLPAQSGVVGTPARCGWRPLQWAPAPQEKVLVAGVVADPAVQSLTSLLLLACVG